MSEKTKEWINDLIEAHLKGGHDDEIIHEKGDPMVDKIVCPLCKKREMIFRYKIRRVAVPHEIKFRGQDQLDELLKWFSHHTFGIWSKIVEKPEYDKVKSFEEWKEDVEE